MVRVAAHRSRRGLLDAAMRRSLAAELREIAPEVRMFDPPVELAVGAGFEVAAKRGPTSDKPSAAMVVYAWNRDRRRRGLRVYVGLARAFLLRLGVAHDWHDVWLLALELAVPHHMLGVGLERTLRGQRHCPEHVIREVFAARWL